MTALAWDEDDDEVTEQIPAVRSPAVEGLSEFASGTFRRARERRESVRVVQSAMASRRAQKEGAGR